SWIGRAVRRQNPPICDALHALARVSYFDGSIHEACRRPAPDALRVSYISVSYSSLGAACFAPIGGCGVPACAVAGRHSSEQWHLARGAFQARGRRPVPDRDRTAWLRRPRRPLGAGAAALSRLGRAAIEGGQGGAAA